MGTFMFVLSRRPVAKVASSTRRMARSPLAILRSLLRR
jgi:hypothetical protein